ncbi:MAG: hypothetical protein SX243_21945, partial [Acidobacteriota bacterium]|nr:hypothetical protein [Acidobacteriota bacterium]
MRRKGTKEQTFETSTRFRSVLGALWLPIALALTIPLPAAADVYLATDRGALPADRTTGKIFDPLPGTADARAVAVDPARELVWVHTGEELAAFGLDGTPVLSVPADAGEEGIAQMAIDPEDGTVWFGSGEAVSSFAPTGQALQEILLAADLRSLLTTEVGLWIATAEAVTLHDPVTGAEVRKLPLGGGTEVRALAVDAESVWVASDEQILRFVEDPSGEAEDGKPGESENAGAPTNSFAAPGILALAPGGDETLWVTDGVAVTRVDATGEVLTSAQPFGPAGESADGEGELGIHTLVADAYPGSVWAVSEAGAVRLSPSGWEIERFEPPVSFGEPVEVRGLVPGTVPEDTVGPELEILRPADGAELEELRPEIELAWSDPGTGVRPESLALTLDGQPFGIPCTVSPQGAVCRPNEDLAEDEHLLSATVADHGGVESLPSQASFQILSGDAGDDGDDVDEAFGGPDPSIYQPVEIDRGLMPNRPFQGLDGIDAVDLTSGNLVLRIPLGQSYSVGDRLSYGFQAVYNSNVWEPLRVECYGDCTDIFPPVTFSSTNLSANAGLGWEVHFGRLFAPAPDRPGNLRSSDGQRFPNVATKVDPSDVHTRWLYVAPDGSQHSLHLLPGRRAPGDPQPSILRHSKDGSQLRLVLSSSTQVELQHPDGVVSVFERTDSFLGTLFCGVPGEGGNVVTGCWRLKERKDPYGNRISLAYQLNASGQEVWTVSDSTGRSHKLFFDLDAISRAGGDGPGPFTTPDGDEWGDLRRILSHVQLASFGGSTATYNFHYRTETTMRGCPHDDDFPTASNTLTTRVLDGIDGPEGQSWKFDTFTNPSGGCSNLAGKIEAVQAPTKGWLRFEYSFWEFPTRCVYRNDPDLEPQTLRYGVTTKIQQDANRAEIGRWNYASELLPVIPTSDWSGTTCRRAEYRKTTVTDPIADNTRTKTVNYTSVYEGSSNPVATTPMNELQVTDSGLPYSKHSYTLGPGNQKLFLSQKTSKCNTRDGICTPVRSIYRRYAM